VTQHATSVTVSVIKTIFGAGAGMEFRY